MVRTLLLLSFHAFSDSQHQVVDETYWSALCIGVCIVSHTVKSVGSTDGMNRCVATSPEMEIRKTDFVEERIADAIQVYKSRDFDKLASIIMAESDALHSICHSAKPSIEYLSNQSYYVINLVHFVNAFFGRNLVSSGALLSCRWPIRSMPVPTPFCFMKKRTRVC